MKPGDLNKLEIHWPEMPTSLSEVGDLVIDVGSAATSAVGSLATKAMEAVKQKEVPHNLNNIIFKKSYKILCNFLSFMIFLHKLN